MRVAGQAKVQQHRAAVRAEQHVGRFQVQVHGVLLVQRVGRALRSKKGIKGHPHGKAATITFFAPRWNQDTDEIRKRHRDEAMMLACFMYDHETGARFMNDPLGDVLRSRAKGKQRGAVERLVHRLKASDAERSERSRRNLGAPTRQSSTIDPGWDKIATSSAPI